MFKSSSFFVLDYGQSGQHRRLLQLLFGCYWVWRMFLVTSFRVELGGLVHHYNCTNYMCLKINMTLLISVICIWRGKKPEGQPFQGQSGQHRRFLLLLHILQKGSSKFDICAAKNWHMILNIPFTHILG